MIIRKSNTANKAIAKIKHLGLDTRQGIRRAFYLAGKDLITTSKQDIISGPKTGKLYRIKGRKKRHRASAPGEAPANRTGALQKSVDFFVQGSNQMTFGAGGLDVIYANFLELGTRKMEARPFLSSSLSKNDRNIENHLGRSIVAELKRK